MFLIVSLIACLGIHTTTANLIIFSRIERLLPPPKKKLNKASAKVRVEICATVTTGRRVKFCQLCKFSWKTTGFPA